MGVIDPKQITGLVLAGGRGSRMGGVDKGLQLFNGSPLAQWALQRLAPQVGPVAVNANRHLSIYADFGVPVWPDTRPDQPGPLAGFLAGLSHCAGTHLVTVPCDSPRFPQDLVARLSTALAEQKADIAMASTRRPDGSLDAEPVFCLMPVALRADLTQFMDAGHGRVRAWAERHAMALVPFDRPGDDPRAFANANTLAELRTLARL